MRVYLLLRQPEPDLALEICNTTLISHDQTRQEESEDPQRRARHLDNITGCRSCRLDEVG